MQNRNIYITIALAFIVLLGIILFKDNSGLSNEDLNATVDARVALLLTEQNLSGTSEAQIEAQRPLILTDIALAYPSETATATNTATFTPSATSLDPPTQTPTPTATPLQLRGFRGIRILDDINASGILAVDNTNLYFAMTEANILRVYDINTYRLLWEQETESPITLLVWSPTDARILSGHEDGQIFLWRFNEAEPVLRLEIGQPLSDLLWSPDGSQFIAAFDNEVQVLDAEEGTVINTVSVALQPRLSWQRMNRALILVDSEGIFTLDLSNQRLQVISNIVLPVTAFEVASDAFTIIYIDGNNVINKRVISVSQATYRLTPTSSITSLDWSPDNESLALTGSDNSIQIRNADSGSTILSLQHNAALRDAQWTSNNRRVFVLTDFIYVIELPRD
jgi:WD40 repeat protein